MVDALSSLGSEILLILLTAFVTYKVSQWQFQRQADKTALIEFYQLAMEYDEITNDLKTYEEAASLSETGRFSKEVSGTRASLEERRADIVKHAEMKAYSITNKRHHELIAGIVVGMQAGLKGREVMPTHWVHDMASIINKSLLFEIYGEQWYREAEETYELEQKKKQEEEKSSGS
ncbi:MAG: hypothetical protein AAF699_14315 [Pseudomonadota bacterium]